MIARRDTIAAAIRVTQEKIKNGYPKGIRYFDMPCDTQGKIGVALADIRQQEPELLKKLQALQSA